MGAGLLALIAASGCGSGRSAEPAEQTPYTADVAPDGRPVPLGCELAVPKRALDEIPVGLIRPVGARVIVESALPRTDDPRITVVEGYVELPPTKLLAALRAVAGARVLFEEDEEIEAELLIGTRRSQNFWKVVRACEVASRFTALVVAADDAAAVGGAPRTQTKRGRAKRPR